MRSRPTAANELVLYVISQTSVAPGLGTGINSLYTGTGTVIGYAGQASAGATPTVDYTSGRTDGIITTFSMQPSNPNPWTHVAQANEPLSTFSLDSLWLEMPSNLPTSASFTVPSPVENLVGQIVSVGNASTSAPVDGSQEALGVGAFEQWAAPPAMGVTPNIGLLLYAWGANG
jgi:hypothetical protein